MRLRAILQGARQVVVIDRLPDRLSMAEAAGAIANTRRKSGLPGCRV